MQPDSRQSSPDVSIIIASYNTRNLLSRCLASVFAHPTSVTTEVLVVDDASTDGSAELVRRQFPQVQLLQNSHNLGYARANNRAIARSKGRFVYLLNSDAAVHEGTIDALANFLAVNPQAGAAGSLLYGEDGSLQASVKAFPSILSGLFGKRSVLARWFPRSRYTRSELLQWKKDGNEPFEAGYVSSASLMIPRHIIDGVGGLDPRFWHFIDADYCRRIWRYGKRVYCVPAASALHREHSGGTMASRRHRFRSVWTFHRGAYLFFLKHTDRPFWHPLHLVIPLGLGPRFAISLVIQLVKELTGTDRRYFEDLLDDDHFQREHPAGRKWQRPD